MWIRLANSAKPIVLSIALLEDSLVLSLSVLQAVKSQPRFKGYAILKSAFGHFPPWSTLCGASLMKPRRTSIGGQTASPNNQSGLEKIGRDDRIRTYDPHTPSVMRYQAALRPDRQCLNRQWKRAYMAGFVEKQGCLCREMRFKIGNRALPLRPDCLGGNRAACFAGGAPYFLPRQYFGDGPCHQISL